MASTLAHIQILKKVHYEHPYCTVLYCTHCIQLLSATLVLSAQNKSNPHFANETICGLHSGGHGSKYQS